MNANPLKRILRYLQRTRKTVPDSITNQEEMTELSPTQRAIARAARKNPWFLAG